MLIPSRPMTSKCGVNETSKPVAQMTTSTLCSLPDSSTTPSFVNLTTDSWMTLTLSFVRACKYPEPGVILRQPRSKEGTMCLTRSGSCSSWFFMMSATRSRDTFWSLLFLCICSVLGYFGQSVKDFTHEREAFIEFAFNVATVLGIFLWIFCELVDLFFGVCRTSVTPPR